MMRPSRTLLLCSAAMACLSLQPAHGQVLPTGGAFVRGTGGIAGAGSTLTVTQTSARGVINWQGFSIGAGGKVQFNNGTGATLNRVLGGDLSQIDGQLSATGSVYLINPNGVVVGPGGRVITDGSFVASTRDVSNDQFMGGGALSFSGTSRGGVSNAGSILSQGGDVVLIGAFASNSGDVSAPNGTAALAAANQVVLSAASGPSGIYVASDASAVGDVTNSGRISAAAAELASAGGNVYALAGNRGGLVQAVGSRTIDGQVWLTAPNGSTSITGAVSASDADGAGGTIIADGRQVSIGATAVLSASGTRGGSVLVGVTAAGGQNEAERTDIASGAQILATGQGAGAGGYVETSGETLTLGAATVNAGLGGAWVLDPFDVTIGAGGASAIDTALNAGTNVTVQSSATAGSAFGVTTAGEGDITVGSAISWNTSANLTLTAFNSVIVKAPITVGGAGGLFITTNNNIGGASSGVGTLSFPTGNVSFTGVGGSLTINGAGYTLVSDLATLGADITANPSGNYALAKGIDATGTPFSTEPVSTTFTGTFEGLGNSISNLTINSSDVQVGLFAVIGAGGLVRDLHLINDTTNSAGGVLGEVGALAGENDGQIENVTATGNVVTGVDSFINTVGGLVGENLGSIRNASVSGSASATSGAADTYVGGLVGFNSQGTIDSSSTAGSVEGVNTGTSPSGFELAVGGLVGHSFRGTISNSSSTARVTADVTGATSVSTGSAVGVFVGGLVGISFVAAIDNSGATGAVRASIDGSIASNGPVDIDVGGLVGQNFAGTISSGFATGAASADIPGSMTASGATLFVGGLVGQSQAGTISDAYATGKVTASDSSGAVINIGAGGLVGATGGDQISEAYATGSVTGADGAAVGGLVGQSTDNTTITDAYAIGRVEGGAGAQIGGLIGSDDGGGIFSNLYWDTSTSGTTDGLGGGSVAGMTGLTTKQWLTAGPIATSTFDTSSIWVAGYPYPVLKALPYVLVTANGTQTYGGLTTNITIASILDQNGNDATSLVGLGGLSYITAAPTTAVVGSGPFVLGGLGGTVSPGFQLTYIGAVTIDPATLTYVANAASRTYGGSNPGFTGTVTGFVNGDTLSGSTSGALNFTSPATSGSNVGSYAINGSGLTAGNYVFVQAAGNATALTIDPATLTYVANAASRTYGGSNPTFTGSVTGLVNGDTLSGATGGTLNFTSPATSGSNVGSYAINGSGLTAGNYVFVQAAGNATALTIDPATLTYVANAASRTYGASNPTFTGTVTGFVNGDTLSGSTSGALNFTSPATSGSNVGSYAINGSGLTAGNYVFVQAGSNATALTIDPATLTYVANAASRTYGGSNPTFTGSVTGFVNGDTLSGSTSGALNFTSPATSGSNVGSYAINGSGLTAGNYVFVQAAGNATALTIDPATLTYVANAASRTYGASNPTFTGSVTGFVNGDTLSGATGGTLNFTSPTTSGSNVGSYAINGSGLTAGNYVFVQALGNATALTIDPATLTYVANAASRTYGASNPTFTGSVTGFVNGDTLSGATSGTLNFTSPATSASNVGSYAINGSGLTAGNYVFVQAAGNATALTIDPATLTYVANAASRTYGASNPTFTGSVTGFVNGDTLSGATSGTLNFTSPATSASNVGSYAINGSGLTAGNYVFVQALGNATALTIDPATLTYVANAASRTYGASNPTFTGSVTGFVNGDTLSGATSGTLNFTSPATSASNVGSYAINGSGLTAGNYVFVQAAGNATALTIDPATLTYVANAASRTYGASNPTFTGSVTGFVNGDTQSGATSGTLNFTSPATSASNVGSYAINGSGLTAGNYVFVQAVGNATALTIDPATLTYVANAASRTYGASNPTFTGSVTGFVNGDTLSGSTSGTLNFTSPATSASNVGSYAINGSGLTAGNYVFVQAAGNATALTIDPATLTYVANAASRTYGGSNPTFTGTVTGFVNGDTLSGATGGTLNFTSPATSGSNVGSYAINGSGLTAGNYVFVQAATNFSALTINPATLFIRASDQTKIAGQTLVLGTTDFTASGLFNGDSVSGVSLTSPGAASTASFKGSPYAIDVSGAVGSGLSNYVIAYQPGVLTVNLPPFTVDPGTLAVLQTPLQPAPWNGADWMHRSLGNGLDPLAEIVAASDATGMILSPDDTDADKARLRVENGRHLILQLPSPRPAQLTGTR